MANRDFKIELDNVEMINGSDDLLKDTKVTKVTLTGENKLNSLNSTFENCTELTAIEGDVNLDGVSDMTEMTLNTPLDEVRLTNPTEENIQTDNSLNQVTNVKIGGTKYAKGGVQDIVGSLEWNTENFAYEDVILDNVYTNSSSIEESKNITVSDTLEQRATSIEITGQTYENLVDGKATKNLLDEMSMQQTEGKPTQFTPHMEQPICLEYIEGQTYQNLVEGKGEETLISEYSSVINDFVPNTFKPPQNQLICLESMEGETYRNLIKGKGEYKLTDSYSATWTESDNSIDNPPAMIEIPEIWGNTVQDENDLNIIQSVGDLYVDESGEPILDEEGNEQYKLDIISHGYTTDEANYRTIIQNLSLQTGFKNIVVAYGTPIRAYFQCIAKIDTTKAKSGCFCTFSQGGDYSINYNSTDHSLKLSQGGSEYFLGYVSHNEPFSITIKQSNDDKIIHVYFNGIEIVNIASESMGFINSSFVAFNSQFHTEAQGGCDYINILYTQCSKDYGSYICIDEDDWNNINKWNKTTILMPQPLKGIDNVKDKLFYDYKKSMYVIENKIGDFDNINDLSEAILPVSQTIETKILEKPSLETYSPKTYISTNTEIQPSQMSITNKEVKFSPLSLQPSKSYTIQLDSVGKDNKAITVNLGGATTTIQPTNDTSKHHRTSITTPSSLTTDNLDLSGEGVIVNDVMLFEGNTSVIKQDVDYVDGIQSIGEFHSTNLWNPELQEYGYYDNDIFKENDAYAGFISSPLYSIEDIGNSISVYASCEFGVLKAGNIIRIHKYNANNIFINTVLFDNKTLISLTDCAYFRISIDFREYVSDVKTLTDVKIQLEKGNTSNIFMEYGSSLYKIRLEFYDSIWDSI